MLARRIFADGRTRAYAWGRSAAREDVAARGRGAPRDERAVRAAPPRATLLPARRGSTPTPAPPTRRAPRAAPGGSCATARRAYEELTRDAARGQGAPRGAPGARGPTRRASLPGEEDELRAERERLRHVTELALAAASALEALASEERGRGGAGIVAATGDQVAPLEAIAPELAAAGETLRAARELFLREVTTDLRRFLDSLEAEPGRLEEVERRLDRDRGTAPTPRCGHLRRSCSNARAEARARARRRLPTATIRRRRRPTRSPRARPRSDRHPRRAHAPPRREAAPRFARRSPPSSRASAWARASSASRSARGCRPFRRRRGPCSRCGRTQVFPFGPVAETASGGELSGVALAIAAVAGGDDDGLRRDRRRDRRGRPHMRWGGPSGASPGKRR